MRAGKRAGNIYRGAGHKERKKAGPGSSRGGGPIRGRSGPKWISRDLCLHPALAHPTPQRHAPRHRTRVHARPPPLPTGPSALQRHRRAVQGRRQEEARQGPAQRRQASQQQAHRCSRRAPRGKETAQGRDGAHACTTGPGRTSAAKEGRAAQRDGPVESTHAVTHLISGQTRHPASHPSLTLHLPAHPRPGHTAQPALAHAPAHAAPVDGHRPSPSLEPLPRRRRHSTRHGRRCPLPSPHSHRSRQCPQRPVQTRRTPLALEIRARDRNHCWIRLVRTTRPRTNVARCPQLASLASSYPDPEYALICLCDMTPSAVPTPDPGRLYDRPGPDLYHTSVC